VRDTSIEMILGVLMVLFGATAFVLYLDNSDTAQQLEQTRKERDRYYGYIWAWRKLTIKPETTAPIDLADLLADPLDKSRN
jgi:hypothetical protein